MPASGGAVLPADRHEDAGVVVMLGAAWVLLSLAVVPGGTFHPVALLLALCAYPLVAAIALAPGRAGGPVARLGEVATQAADAVLGWSARVLPATGPRRSLRAGLIILAAVAAITAVLFAGGSTGSRGWMAAAGTVALASPWLPGPRLPWWLAMTALAVIATSLSIQVHTPSNNDVWFIVQGGADAVLRGDNMYAQCWPGNTDPTTDCVYPYPPMTSVVLAPARLLLGDVRYGFVVALAISSLGILRLHGGRAGLVLSSLVWPTGLVLADRAWTEPLLLAGIVLAAWAVVRRVPVVPVLAFALALAVKQHMVLLAPLAARWRGMGAAPTMIALGLAALTAVPWLLADASRFIDNAVWLLLELPPRQDSLSLYALALAAGLSVPFAVTAGLIGAALVVALWRCPRTAYGFVTGSAFVLFTLNLVNKQSFFNYHALVLDLLVLALALRGVRAPGRPEPEPASG